MELGRVLMMCSIGRCTEMFRYWLDKANKNGDQADPRQRRSLYWTLNAAIQGRHEPIVRMLLEEVGVDPNWTDPSCTAAQAATPLLTAVRMGRLPVVRLLLDHGADPDAGGPQQPPIAAAVALERLDRFRLLRERGALLDTPGTGSAAMKATKRDGLYSMVDLLKSEGVRA